MNNRQRGIFLQLVAVEEPMTSEQLARELGVSSRTIKTDMAAIAPELADNGVELLSRRNRGYSLQIVDETRFKKFYNVLSLAPTCPETRRGGSSISPGSWWRQEGECW